MVKKTARKLAGVGDVVPVRLPKQGIKDCEILRFSTEGVEVRRGVNGRKVYTVEQSRILV